MMLLYLGVCNRVVWCRMLCLLKKCERVCTHHLDWSKRPGTAPGQVGSQAAVRLHAQCLACLQTSEWRV